MQTSTFSLYILQTIAVSHIFQALLHCSEIATCTSKFQNGAAQSIKNEEESGWISLTNTAVHIFKFQNEVKPNTSDRFQNNVVFILCENSNSLEAARFVDSITHLHEGIKFITLLLPNGKEDNVEEIMNIFQENCENDVSSVVFFSDNRACLLNIMRAVSSSSTLRWTGLLHTTEWFFLSNRNNGLIREFRAQAIPIDFMTIVYRFDAQTIAVAQKSRLEPLKCITYILIKTGTIPAQANEGSSSNNQRQSTNQQSITRGISNLRRNANLYLNSQKSIMAGMNILVAMLPDGDGKLAYTGKRGNMTWPDGYCVAVLRLLAGALGFTYQFVTVKDGGYYGRVLDDGNITGLTGLLARREAALTTMPMSRIENRRGVIDFVPVPITYDALNLVYRLPSAEAHLDTTYFTIFHPDLLLSLIGPLIAIGLMAAIVHLVTRSCTSKKPEVIPFKNIRKLYTCPDHIFFHNQSVYLGQTGRILRASWAMFCVIMSAAYSAYLVTTFAVKPDELSIKSFQQLLSNENIRFGMKGGSTALEISMKTSKDKFIAETWDRLQEFNKSDSRTFSPNASLHVQRILAGDYALLDSYAIYDTISPKYTDIRGYPLGGFEELQASFVAVPKKVFYQDAIRRILLEIEATGIFRNLHRIYLPKRVEVNRYADKFVEKGKAVTYSRIRLVVYFAAASVGLSFLCLGAELVFSRLREVYGNKSNVEQSHSRTNTGRASLSSGCKPHQVKVQGQGVPTILSPSECIDRQMPASSPSTSPPLNCE